MDNIAALPWYLQVGLGVVTAVGMLGMFLLNKGRRDAGDAADIASGHARAATYDMIAKENESLSADNDKLRDQVSELRRIDALHNTQMTLLRRDFAIFKQLVLDGVAAEQALKYAQNSTLADLDDAKP